jgi:ribonuclease-3
MDEYEYIYSRVHYRFSDPQLLKKALTHRSRSAANYERLEFLGDSILGFIIAEWLYYRFPELTEGKLSRMRAAIVRKNTLAQVARSLELGQALILGEGELKSGGHERDSILADVLEAIIGAIFLDGGLAPCKDFVLDVFGPDLDKLRPDTAYKDAKSRLQEYLQKHGLPVPNYLIVNVSGEPHCQTFEVECRIDGVQQTFTATGTSRRNAEQSAAEKAIVALSEQ